jgi:hypothetical protein
MSRTRSTDPAVIEVCTELPSLLNAIKLGPRANFVRSVTGHWPALVIAANDRLGGDVRLIHDDVFIGPASQERLDEDILRMRGDCRVAGFEEP